MTIKRFLAVLGTVLLVVGLAAFGTIKQDIADPITTSNFPQPDWLLQMFFQVTRYCQDGAEMIGVFWIPLGVLLLLVLLPLIDRAANGKNAVKWSALSLGLAILIAWGVLTHHTGSTTPIDSCAACHKAGFGEGFAHAPVRIADFSDRYDNKWLSLHYRYPQYFWMMDADVPKW